MSVISYDIDYEKYDADHAGQKEYGANKFNKLFVCHLNFPRFLKLLLHLQYAGIFSDRKVFAKKKYRQRISAG